MELAAQLLSHPLEGAATIAVGLHGLRVEDTVVGNKVQSPALTPSAVCVTPVIL